LIENASEDGYVKAEIAGVTNTLRFRHSVVVNVPKVEKPYGKEIRSLLTVEEGLILCGSDMSSLEDRIKHHFLYPFDPDYVNDMARDDYDPHIALAIMAGMMTEAEGSLYIQLDSKDDKSEEDKALYSRLKAIRSIAKNGNYACQYGAGPPRIALTANISLEQAKIVHEGYWKLNWAIRKVAEEQKVKTVNGQKWLYNPISGFWYSLREEKDRFSTLVQGTASYVFDEWVREIRTVRPQLTGQFHDEFILTIKDTAQDKCRELILSSLEKLNKRLKLNRELGCSVQFGINYAEIH
jgi:DNA polymerase I-like protein with 3'-5' exonuclease and polymerase domains